MTSVLLQKDTTLTKIFVGGLPYHTTDETLRQFFDKFGEIDEAVVITDRQTGKSRGYGFVTMAERVAAERACKDPNPIIDGRKANVNLAYLGAKPRTLAHDLLAAAFPLGIKTAIPGAYPGAQLARFAHYAPYMTAGGQTFALPGGVLTGGVLPTVSPTQSPMSSAQSAALDYSTAAAVAAAGGQLATYSSYPTVLYGYETVPTSVYPSPAGSSQIIGYITPGGGLYSLSGTTGAAPGAFATQSPSGVGHGLIYPAAAAGQCYQTAQPVSQQLHARMQ